MSITEYQRHQLFTWFEEHMGKERATTMMNLVPPVGWGDVATAGDLQRHAELARHDMLAFRADIERVLHQHRADTNESLQQHRADTNESLQQHRAEASQALQALRQEIAVTRHEIVAMEARVGRTFGTWLFASQAAVIAAMAVLLAIN